MSKPVKRPTRMGRWALLGRQQNENAANTRSASPNNELACPVGHLLLHAGEKEKNLRGKSDISSRQATLLQNHFGINFGGVRRLLGLCQIESDSARADKAAEVYESLGIEVEPKTSSEEGADVG